MSVRAAQFRDIPAIVKLMERSHRRSRDFAITTFDEIEAKQLLCTSIQRHGQQNYMGSLVLVAERDNKVQGFVIGINDQVYPCIKELKVTDLLFSMAENASMNDARTMVLELTRWGRDNPKVIKVLLGITDDLAKVVAVERLYESVGLEKCGSLYRMDFDRRIAEAS